MVYLSYWVIHSNCAIHYKGIVNGKKKEKEVILKNNKVKEKGSKGVI